MSSTLKQKVYSGVVWRGMERLSGQAFQFVFSIILARLLQPVDFGTVALLTVFLALSSVFVDSGFGSALVQKKNVDPVDYDSVFYLNLCVACVLYLILYMVAPWVSLYYHTPILSSLMRCLAFSLILNALSVVQNAILTREMRFKSSFIISMSQVIPAGVIGIVMAYAGFGVWSLVVGSLGGVLAGTITRWVSIGWYPGRNFSLQAVSSLFRFGSKILCVGFIDVLFNNLYNLIIGKLFSTVTLGLYSRGQMFPSAVVGTVNGTIGSVIYPALVSVQDDKARIKNIIRRLIRINSFLIFPATFGLAAVAKPLVQVLLTDKWIPCVPFLQVACFAYAFWPLHTAHLNCLTATGRSDIFLKVEVLKKVLFAITILISYRFGIMAMVVAGAVLSPVSLAINAWPNCSLLGYTIREQVSDVLPFFLMAILMALAIIALSSVFSNVFFLLAMQGVLGISVYWLGIFLADKAGCLSLGNPLLKECKSFLG